MAEHGTGGAGPLPAGIVLGAVPVDLVRPLRHVVLRPGRPVEETIFPGDDDPATLHVAARLGGLGEIVAVGTLLREAPPWPEPGAPDPCWRVRGMATNEVLRGRGFGRAVLGELVRLAAPPTGAVLWCNARTGAVPFYERAGFARVGEPFDLRGIGPHLAMRRQVRPR